MKALLMIGGVIIFCALFSCAYNSATYDSDTPQGSINLKYNVQQRVDNNLLLEVIDLYDNRCPIGSVCSNGGTVDVSFKIFVNNKIETKMISFSDFPNLAQPYDTISGYRIELVKVLPLPYAGNPVEKLSNYTVCVLVSKF